MTKRSTLDEQIARAQRVVASWPVGRLQMMQLQGTDDFCDRARALLEERTHRVHLEADSKPQHSSFAAL